MHKKEERLENKNEGYKDERTQDKDGIAHLLRTIQIDDVIPILSPW